MRIKKYVTKSMREALIEIRNELGEGAVILKTRKVPGRGFPFGGADVEVTAAIDEESKPQPAFPRIMVDEPAPAAAGAGTYQRPRSQTAADAAPAVAVRAWKPPMVLSSERAAPAGVGTEHGYTELKEDIKHLADMVKSVLKNGGTCREGGFEGGWGILYKRLIDAEVKTELAASLIDSMRRDVNALSNGQAEARIFELLHSHFPVSGPVRCKKRGPAIVAFVGPTGSGKTTTLAKLVAHCRLNGTRRVSVITADTYRIAAIDQIGAFADIVQVRLQTVFSPAEVPAALAACVNDDVVFVDTAGRSQRNGEHMNDLREMLRALRPDETHLVVSATTRDSDLLAAAERYRAVGADRLLFTKLDETSQVGGIFNCVNATGMHVSFFTVGQRVPDDIEVAQGARFVKRLWEGNPA